MNTPSGISYPSSFITLTNNIATICPEYDPPCVKHWFLEACRQIRYPSLNLLPQIYIVSLYKIDDKYCIKSVPVTSCNCLFHDNQLFPMSDEFLLWRAFFSSLRRWVGIPISIAYNHPFTFIPTHANTQWEEKREKNLPWIHYYFVNFFKDSDSIIVFFILRQPF